MAAHEVREYKRAPAYLGAKIYFEHRPSTFDCLVKNVSDNGALLNIEAIWGIPDSFRLHIPKYDAHYVCQTKWRTHNKLGVQFHEIDKNQGAIDLQVTPIAADAQSSLHP